MTPPLPTRIGKTTRRKKIDGTPLVHTVVDEVVLEASSCPGKAFCLQELQFDDGREELRLCYYMIAHKPRMKGKWAFGQFAPMMTVREFQLLIDRATQKGWLESATPCDPK